MGNLKKIYADFRRTLVSSTVYVALTPSFFFKEQCFDNDDLPKVVPKSMPKLDVIQSARELLTNIAEPEPTVAEPEPNSGETQDAEPAPQKIKNAYAERFTVDEPVPTRNSDFAERYTVDDPVPTRNSDCDSKLGEEFDTADWL